MAVGCMLWHAVAEMHASYLVELVSNMHFKQLPLCTPIPLEVPLICLETKVPWWRSLWCYFACCLSCICCCLHRQVSQTSVTDKCHRSLTRMIVWGERCHTDMADWKNVKQHVMHLPVAHAFCEWRPCFLKTVGIARSMLDMPKGWTAASQHSTQVLSASI